MRYGIQLTRSASQNQGDEFALADRPPKQRKKNHPD
jgi:hypothetical protein